MDKVGLLCKIWSMPMHPCYKVEDYSSVRGVAYEIVDTGVERKLIEWFDDPEKLNGELVQKVLDAGTEAFICFSSLNGYYCGVPVRRKR